MKPLRRLPSIALAFLLLARITPAVAQSSYFPEKGAWERMRPEELGLDPGLVQQAIQAVADGEVTSPRDLALNHLMTFGREPLGDAVGPFGTRGDATALIVYRGYIVGEGGEPDRVDQTFSVAKSVLSSVVGIAWDRGLIGDLNARVGPGMAPVIPLNGGLGSAAVTPAGVPVSQPLELFSGEHNSTITWDHLLRQTSDWEGTLWGKPDWADRPSTNRDEWTTRPRNPAGSVFDYNDVRVNLLALAALNVWRRPLPQVAKELLFDRIGASDTWRWTGYDNSWILLDGVPVQSVSGGSHWGGRAVHQRVRSRAVRAAHASPRKVGRAAGPVRRMGDDGDDLSQSGSGLRLHELVSRVRPLAPGVLPPGSGAEHGLRGPRERARRSDALDELHEPCRRVDDAGDGKGATGELRCREAAFFGELRHETPPRRSLHQVELPEWRFASRRPHAGDGRRCDV